MSLTRKMLSAMGIEPDKIDQIIESHSETVEGLKNEAAELREQAGKAATLEKELAELKAKQPKEDWQAKYEKLSGEFEDFKRKSEQEKADAEKARLYRSILREAGIDEKRVEAIMKVTDLADVTVKDGAIEGVDDVKKAVAEEWAAFIPQKRTDPAPEPNPPKRNKTVEGANPEVVARLQKRHERIYGKATDTKEQ